MSEQRAGSVVPAEHRSIVPNIPGAPWWGAVLIATISTLLGLVIDAGHRDLTHVFAGCYIVGCVAAVLAVRQAAVFTAVIQPPLLLFCAVPAAYWHFHGHKIGGLKDLLINCGYPLIERFPLMLGTAGLVLVIGMFRWFLASSLLGGARKAVSGAEATDGSDGSAATGIPFVGGIVAKLTELIRPAAGEEGDADAELGARPAHGATHARRSGARSARATRGGRSAEYPGRARARDARADDGEPLAERPRRARRDPAEAANGYDFEPGEPPRRPRRPRPPMDGDPRAQPGRGARRESLRNPYEGYERPSGYERPAPRGSRFDPNDRYAPPAAHYNGYDSPYGGRREAGYDAYDGYDVPDEPPRRRAAPNGDTSHHPISRVRYRGDAARDERRDEPADRRRRSGTPGRPGRPPAESWEYDG